MTPLQGRYKIDNVEYVYEPDVLRFHYSTFYNMSDEEFVEDIFNVLHFACFMSFVKKIDHVSTLSDKGIIHELVHIGNNSTKGFSNIRDVRDKFNKLFGNVPDIFDINKKYP